MLRKRMNVYSNHALKWFRGKSVISQKLIHGTFNPLYSHPYYSIRRYFVDKFYFYNVPKIPHNSLILDLGGTKAGKRGQFDLNYYNLDVTYLNIATDKCPDIQANATFIPIESNYFDVVICAEVLEHVSEPTVVLHEIQRVLKMEGILLATVPFLFRLHYVPTDYARYTDMYWQENLSNIGFSKISIESQAFFWGCLFDMIRDVTYENMRKDVFKSKWFKFFLEIFLVKMRERALTWDANISQKHFSFFTSYTTGFGIKAIKSQS